MKQLAAKSSEPKNTSSRTSNFFINNGSSGKMSNCGSPTQIRVSPMSSGL